MRAGSSDDLGQSVCLDDALNHPVSAEEQEGVGLVFVQIRSVGDALPDAPDNSQCGI